MKNTLDIICERNYKNRFYYLDTKMNVYGIAPGVYLPRSPMLNYKKYNHKAMYKLIEEPSKELIDKFGDYYKKGGK